MDIQFILIFLIITVGLIGIPLMALGMLHRSYGPRLPGKVALWTWIVAITYTFLFFTYAPSLIPDAWKLEAKQEYVCEWKIVYVESYPK